MLDSTGSYQPIVIEAVSADADGIYACLLAMENEGGQGIPRSDAKVRRVVYQCCTDGGRAAIIRDNDRNIIATAGVVPLDVWYSEQWHLQEIWFYVRPEHRKGGVLANLLFDWLKDHRAYMALQLGYDVKLLTGPSPSFRLKAKIRWWARRARQFGAIFVIDGSKS